jgi:hypothetical protein
VTHGVVLSRFLSCRVADIEDSIETIKEEAKKLEISRHFVVERVRPCGD